MDTLAVNFTRRVPREAARIEHAHKDMFLGFVDFVDSHRSLTEQSQHVRTLRSIETRRIGVVARARQMQ